MMKNNIRLSREKAFEIASNEWNAGNKFVIRENISNNNRIVSVDEIPAIRKCDDTFPEIEPISKDSLVILEQMVKNVVNQKGTIVFRDVLFTISVKNNIMWDYNFWHTFLISMIENKNKIMNHFGVNRNFVIAIDGSGYEYLRCE